MKFYISSETIWILGVIVAFTTSDKYSKLEDEYVQRFGNDPQNPEGMWSEAAEMEANDKLATFCSRIHFLNGKNSYEMIDEAYAQNATLRFTRSNGTYKPMQVIVVNFTSNREKMNYYITKGTRDDCLFYLDPVDTQKSEYHLIQQACECIFF